jgi:demethylmenaquinone methyltransferase/2-methoxy-6-polyprenyl-1,4-benzoquinol methylase
MNSDVLPVNRTKAEARNSYNKLSRWYDLLAGSTERKYREIGLELLDVQEGEDVFEIGYGTGHSILAMADDVGESGNVYAIDISDGMHAITQERVEQAGQSDRVELYVGDVMEMDFEANGFDAIFMSFTLELFDTPEIPVLLEKCRCALRSGGRICVVSLAKSGGSNLMVRIYEWFHEVMPRYADCRPIFVRKSLEQAGLKVSEVRSMRMWGIPVEIVLAYKVS